MRNQCLNSQSKNERAVSDTSAGQAYENKDIPARAFFDSTIMMDSGSVYGVTVCWPTMDVVQVTVLD